MSQWVGPIEEIFGKPLKEKQVAVLDLLLQKKHVFSALPTGYGKSVCFGMFPAAFEKVHPGEQAIALVISPLNSLSTSHKESWTEKGVKSVVLQPLKEMEDESVKGVQDGEYTLIFASPEIVHSHHWWSTLKKLRDRIRLLVIDEAHCLSRWGTTFRADYLRVVQLRAILSKATVLALTATATTQLIKDVSLRLGLVDKMSIISLSPDRPEIYIRLTTVGQEIDDSLSWYAELLKEKGAEAPKAIIYAKTISAVIQVYFYLNTYLGDMAINEAVDEEVEGRYVEMYHGKTDTESQQRIVVNFRHPSSTLRCVVASIAFGLGVDIPNIRYVLHWGPAKDAMAYWQEVGRCSRDAEPGEAITYVYPKSKDKRIVKESMQDILHSSKDKSVCLRKKILSYMEVSIAKATGCQSSRCCYNCSQREVSSVTSS